MSDETNLEPKPQDPGSTPEAPRERSEAPRERTEAPRSGEGQPPAGQPPAGRPHSGGYGGYGGDRRPRPRSDDGGDRPPRGRGGGGGRYRPFFRRKFCKFCTRKYPIVYRDADALKRFVTDRGKILPRRITGTCPKHQRALAKAIKQARSLALLPYAEK